MGDAARFDDLFLSILPDLRRRVMTIARDKWEADDVVQDLYVSFRRRPTLCRAALAHPNPSGYLHRAAINLLYDSSRQARRRQRLLIRLTANADLAWDGGLGHGERQIVVNDALRHLTTAEAEAIILVDLYGQTLDGAAQILGVHRGTVHRNRQRALERLRRMFQPAAAGLRAGRQVGRATGVLRKSDSTHTSSRPETSTQ